MNMLKKATFAAALAASALAAATPAMARPYYGGHHGDTAGWAIGAGILGLAVGAAIASDHHDRYDERRDYDNRYEGGGYVNGGYNNGWSYREGYYYDQDGRRYDRDAYNRWCRDHDDRRRGYDRDDYYSRRGW